MPATALERAALISKCRTGEVPRTCATVSGMADLGYGKGYQYALISPATFSIKYLPAEIRGTIY